MAWIKKFKIALIEQDVETLISLLDDMPEFSNIEQMKEVSYLIQEVFYFANNSKNETSVALKRLKKSMEFFDKNNNKPQYKLNISS
jgi:hypothetical protein